MPSEALIVAAIPLGILLIGLMWVIGTRNRLTRLKLLVKESWAQVDVALKRRYDLIPNLVETCRAYAAHEKEVFERVIQARNQAVSAGGHAPEENAMVVSVNRMLARAEAYPDLRSNEHFLELQRELANTEDRIAAARRFYNANVRDYNTAQEQFPTSLLAGAILPPLSSKSKKWRFGSRSASNLVKACRPYGRLGGPFEAIFEVLQILSS